MMTELQTVQHKVESKKDKIERQRTSRLGELVQGRDNPGRVAAEVMAAALYGPRHPYGYTEIGTESSLRGLMRDDMVAFWERYFVPGNAALIVAGDISMAELRVLAEKVFGAWEGWMVPRSELGGSPPLCRRFLMSMPGFFCFWAHELGFLRPGEGTKTELIN